MVIGCYFETMTITDEPIWRLKKVVKSGEELVWTELKGDNEILKELRHYLQTASNEIGMYSIFPP